MEEFGVELLFLPPASSVMNPIETLWAVIKRRWRQKLLMTDVELVGQRWIESNLGQICSQIEQRILEKVAFVHLKEARHILQEALHYY